MSVVVANRYVDAYVPIIHSNGDSFLPPCNGTSLRLWRGPQPPWELGDRRTITNWEPAQDMTSLNLATLRQTLWKACQLYNAIWLYHRHAYTQWPLLSESANEYIKSDCNDCSSKLVIQTRNAHY